MKWPFLAPTFYALFRTEKQWKLSLICLRSRPPHVNGGMWHDIFFRFEISKTIGCSCALHTSANTCRFLFFALASGEEQRWRKYMKMTKWTEVSVSIFTNCRKIQRSFYSWFCFVLFEIIAIDGLGWECWHLHGIKS